VLFLTKNLSLIFSLLLSLFILPSAFAAPPTGPPAGDPFVPPGEGGLVDPDTPEADLRPGDIVDEYTVDLSADVEGNALGERVSTDTALDCEELSDYYAYREATDEVQCTRTGGPGSCDFQCRAVRQAGCFSPETLVLMGDGVTSKMITSINQGDYVWNPVKKKPVRVRKIVQGPELKPLFEIGYGPYRTHVTEEHPMVLQKSVNGSFHKTALNSSGESLNATVRIASEVTIDDKILGADGQFHQVSVVRKLPLKANQYVINLELDGESDSVQDHLIVADGIITGDYFVQTSIGSTK